MEKNSIAGDLAVGDFFHHEGCICGVFNKCQNVCQTLRLNGGGVLDIRPETLIERASRAEVKKHVEDHRSELGRTLLGFGEKTPVGRLLTQAFKTTRN